MRTICTAISNSFVFGARNCGDPSLRYGIILAKSQEAKAHGVITGEAVWEARQKCPGLLLIPANHRKYALYARRMRKSTQLYSLVEPYGMDESWLDVSAHATLKAGRRSPPSCGAAPAGNWASPCRWESASTRCLPSWAPTCASRTPPR